MRKSPVRHPRRGGVRRDRVRYRSTTVGNGSAAAGLAALAVIALVYLGGNSNSSDDAAGSAEKTRSSSSTARATTSGLRSRETVTVVEELDGDTLLVRRPGTSKTVRVRLIGIDSPEISHDGKPAQCGADAARHRLRSLRGEQVDLIPDPSQDRTDRYGRLLAYVQHSKTDVGAGQLAAGAAREYTYQNRAYQRQDQYRSAQKQAERDQSGLWKACKN